MKKNIIWETFVSIIIAVTIIMILFISLYKILDYNQEIDDNYSWMNYVNLLENNTNGIVEKIDTSMIQEKEIFYIYKNNDTFEILTWSINEKYRYINNLGEYVEDIQTAKKIYSRFCLVERDTIEWQSIKCSIKELVRK